MFLSILRVWLLIAVSAFSAQAEELTVVTTFSEKLGSAIIAQFKQDHPGITVRLVNRRSDSILRLMNKPSTRPVDIIMSSSVALFTHLKKRQQLTKVTFPDYITNSPAKNLKLTGPDNYYGGFAISGFGLMFNHDYLSRNQLPQPTQWHDLARPEFYHHIMMSSPARSSTNHVMVEHILQQYGWDKGWQLLVQIGGNLSSITARSFGVQQAINRGLTGAGPVVDFFANQSKQFGSQFSYFKQFPVNLMYVGITRTSENKQQASQFINYLYSDRGSAALESPEIGFLPLAGLQTSPLDERFNIFDQQKPIDQQLLLARLGLVSALFDHMISFNLSELNKTFSTIHQAEKSVRLKPELTKQLAKAKTLATQLPVTSRQSENSDFLALFSPLNSHSSITSPELLALYQSWDQQNRQNLQQAHQIAVEIVEKAAQ